MEEELFLETDWGRLNISRKMTDKYKLRKGDLSPFTCLRIVDADGDAAPEKPREKVSADSGNINVDRDAAVEQQGGVLLQKSEIIDISQGADSYDQGCL